MNRKLFAQRVLIAFEGVDLGDAEVERISEADDLRISLREELELCVADSGRAHGEFGIESRSVNQAEAAVSIRPPRNQAISAIVAGVAGSIYITKDELLGCLVLEADAQVQNLALGSIRRDAEAGDGCSKVVGLVTEGRVAADLRRRCWRLDGTALLILRPSAE